MSSVIKIRTRPGSLTSRSAAERLPDGSVAQFAAYAAIRTVLAGFRFAPRAWALGLAASLAYTYGLFDTRHKKIARANLALAFPEWNSARQEAIISASYRNLARLVVEVSRFPALNPANITRLVRYDARVGLQNFLDAREQGRGVLYLTGHFSSWELLPYAHALYGYPLSFMVRPLDNPYLEGLLDRLRRGCGNQTIPKRNATRPVLEVLAGGGSVGILIDQNVMLNEGAFVPFFGKQACTTTGVARLALKTHAPVIPTCIQWRPGEKGYRIKFWPALVLETTGEREQDVLANTALFNRVLEGMIRQEPESWLWGHRRWNTRPPEDPVSLYANLD